MVKAGTRLESQVCSTQVIVVRSSDGLGDLRCGGSPMLPLGGARDSAPVIDERFSAGSALGKRYVDGAGAELLVTKPGAGTLSVGETPLELKTAQALPASD